MKESGLFLPNGEFISKKQIDVKYQKQPIFETPLPTANSFSYWNQRFQDRQEQYKETAEVRQDHVSIAFPTDTLISFIGDIHAGSPDTNYRRVAEEVDAIVRTPNSYAVLVGDLVDGFFFNEAQMSAMEQPPEQYQYMHALVDYLAQHKKLLVGYSGDHDMWAKKMGLSAYAEFSQRTGAYYMRGVGYVTAKLPGAEYHITAAHRLPGHSMYNKTHPQNRAYKFGGAAGSDIIVGAHTHQKGLSRQYEKAFGGETHPVDYISLGAYKSTDDYAQKLGFAQQKPEEMFGASVLLHKGKKRVEVFDDIVEANRRFS